MSNESAPVLASLTEAQRAELLARLDGLIDRSGGPEACHPFTGGSRVRGYGVLWTRQADGRRRMVKAHRLAFEAATGESPPTVDHECHDSDECQGKGEDCPHRLCCNESHLTPKSLADNSRRARAMVYREECSRGHAATPENIYESPKGDRTCRKCQAENARAGRERARAERPERERQRKYRPRGMSLEQLVEWALDGNDGDGCWEWRDARLDGEGYVQVAVDGRKINAHRIVYTVLVGPIPEGYVVDHTCHDPKVCPGGREDPHRACVNPAHLVAVPEGHNTGAERSSRARPDRCKWEHVFTEENTYVDKRGSRYCRECMKRRQREARERTDREDQRFRVDGKCRNDHDVAAAGLTREGRCAECAREVKRRYKARQGAQRDATVGVS